MPTNILATPFPAAILIIIWKKKMKNETEIGKQKQSNHDDPSKAISHLKIVVLQCYLRGFTIEISTITSQNQDSVFIILGWQRIKQCLNITHNPHLNSRMSTTVNTYPKKENNRKPESSWQGNYLA